MLGRPRRRAFGAIVFLGHQCPIPAQDGVRCDDTRDGRQSASAKNLAFHGQAAALVVGDVGPSRSVRGAEDSVLLEQVVNNCLLLSVDPAGEEENNEHERRRQRVHGASVPERRAQCKARRDSRLALPGWAEFLDRKPPAIRGERADCRAIRPRRSFRTGRLDRMPPMASTWTRSRRCRTRRACIPSSNA